MDQDSDSRMQMIACSQEARATATTRSSGVPTPSRPASGGPGRSSRLKFSVPSVKWQHEYKSVHHTDIEINMPRLPRATPSGGWRASEHLVKSRCVGSIRGERGAGWPNFLDPAKNLLNPAKPFLASPPFFALITATKPRSEFFGLQSALYCSDSQPQISLLSSSGGPQPLHHNTVNSVTEPRSEFFGLQSA